MESILFVNKNAKKFGITRHPTIDWTQNYYHDKELKCEMQRNVNSYLWFAIFALGHYSNWTVVNWQLLWANVNELVSSFVSLLPTLTLNWLNVGMVFNAVCLQVVLVNILDQTEMPNQCKNFSYSSFVQHIKKLLKTPLFEEQKNITLTDRWRQICSGIQTFWSLR